SFMSSAHAALFGPIDDRLRVANPISAELDVMRPSIVANLVLAAKRSADRGFLDAALFEVGPQYVDDTPTGQRQMATGVRSGAIGPRNWGQPSRAIDSFDAKGDALALIGALGLATENLPVTADAPSWYHPGRSGVVRLGPKTAVAYFG